ncbi:unnamed protein product [Brugia timori]|uniref:Bm7108, isoform f n=2 Tax=Brugia TaxID=6278 RepID=A0A1I9G1C2_BRUMA|nr:Bm7108, isoform f [Brugia malayi]VDO32768.1 unnamed protein product [Brugia timori]
MPLRHRKQNIEPLIRRKDCSCAGSFEIRLVSLTVGSKEEFRPELRICLKHFEKRISYNGECTFGEVTLDAERLRNGTKIEFQFGWPVCAYLLFSFLVPTESKPFA